MRVWAPTMGAGGCGHLTGDKAWTGLERSGQYGLDVVGDK